MMIIFALTPLMQSFLTDEDKGVKINACKIIIGGLIDGQQDKGKNTELLERDARLTTEEIAVMLGLETSAVAAEIAKMEKEHIICGYHAFVNWEKTDDDKISALIELKVTPQPRQRL